MPGPPNPDRPIRVAAISDLHGHLPTDFPRCDVAVIAGDVFPVEDHSLTFQRRWLTEVFSLWLARLPADSVVGIGGNHDLAFEQVSPPVATALPWTFLFDRSVLTRRLWIWGTPWVPWLANGWAFQAPRQRGYELESERYAAIPTGLDLLVSHGPPRGLLDRTIRGKNVGSQALRGTLRRTQVRLLACGHIHEARGLVRDPESGALVANVSAVTEDYEPYIAPVPVFDLPHDGGAPAVIDGFD